jgi:hypothetical protein
MTSLYFAILLSFFTLPVWAAGPPKPRAKATGHEEVTWQNAAVKVDGASVYAAPSFDSTIISYLQIDSKIRVSQRPVQGKGGFGVFYLLKGEGKNIGYVVDTDIGLGSAAKKTATTPDEEEMATVPVYYTRYLGLSIGQIDFTEKFLRRTQHEFMTLFGLKFTGPGVLFDGPPLDVTLNVGWGAPGYYGKYTDKKATGFLFQGDLMLLLPLSDWTKVSLYYGLGLTYSYSKFNVPIAGVTIDSQEFRMGAVGSAGIGVRLGRTAVMRLEGKYYYEKEHYVGYWGSVQTTF